MLLAPITKLADRTAWSRRVFLFRMLAVKNSINRVLAGIRDDFGQGMATEYGERSIGSDPVVCHARSH